jgi:peptide chain release factor 1
MCLLDDSDPTMRSLASEEIDALALTLANLIEYQFPTLLIPRSQTAQLGALMEMRSGVGGSESSLFLAELLRMYQRLATNSDWNATIVAKNESEAGGIKDAVVEFRGNGAYDSLCWETGVHRVQRVPATESSGRTHTSTVAIVVRLLALSFQNVLRFNV